MRVHTINPATEEPVNEYSTMVKPDVDDVVSNARKGLEAWRETTIKERTKLVRRLGKKLLAGKGGLSDKITEEMGKPVKESIPEVEKCAALCDYFAHNAKKFLTEEEITLENGKGTIRFEPLGVVGSIMPWNFPMWQAIRFSIPSIMAGNVQVVKPSSVTPDSGGLQIQRLFDKCKFPEFVFQTAIGGSATGTALVEADIDGASFTGSRDIGSFVAQYAMRNVKKIVLELGSNDPLIVLEDADIDKAVAGAVTGRFINCGQSCVASKRIILHNDIAAAFTEKFIEAVKNLKVGDPTKPDTDIGPVVRDEQRKKLEQQIRSSVQAGAKILLGGSRIEGRGFFFQPTVMGSVMNDMTVAAEEVFGPVAPLIATRNDEDAIGIANDTKYGLGASVWTKNLTRGEKMAKRLNAGIVCVNSTVRSDPRLPFGGIRGSGFGRELHRYGMLEMVNIKSYIINHA